MIRKISRYQRKLVVLSGLYDKKQKEVKEGRRKGLFK